MLDEFHLIEKYAEPLSSPEKSFSLKEDAACFKPPPDSEIVISADTCMEGVHFLPSFTPEDIARRCFRAAMSDLAAMGAKPLGYMMSLQLNEGQDEKWIRRFYKALSEEQDLFHTHLLGGDTVSSKGALCVGVTVLGTVSSGEAFLRSQACLGDRIYLTGPIGDAALGLQLLRDKPSWSSVLNSSERDFLEGAYRCPPLRWKESILMKGCAHAAIDISDGLLADLQHVCTSSGLQAHLRLGEIPFSGPAVKVIEWVQRNEGRDIRPELITHGDDYELLFTLSPGCSGETESLFEKKGFSLTHIGYMADSVYNNDIGKVNVLDDEGKILPFKSLGYQHPIGMKREA
ncbi:MAG: thiamine-phosphate kinase [bacterium]|nr:thiamine-phosphate kinase [bacterium]